MEKKLFIFLVLMTVLLVACDKQKSKRKEVRAVPEAQRLKKFCPQGANSIVKLVTANPYETEGKCYDVAGKAFEIWDAHTGLYELNGQLLHIGFEKSAPKVVYIGTVIGVGMFTYKNGAGGSSTVPSFEHLEFR